MNIARRFALYLRRQLLIEVHQRPSLLLIDLQTLAYCLFTIIITQHQIIASHIIFTRLLRWIVLKMIDTTGSRRSEERRVGKECRSRWWRGDEKKDKREK